MRHLLTGRPIVVQSLKNRKDRNTVFSMIRFGTLEVCLAIVQATVKIPPRSSVRACVNFLTVFATFSAIATKRQSQQAMPQFRVLMIITICVGFGSAFVRPHPPQRMNTGTSDGGMLVLAAGYMSTWLLTHVFPTFKSRETF